VAPESVPPIPLPSAAGAGEGPNPAATPAVPAAGPGILDALLVLLVLALAFLLASTPARNSDLWLHLASGRALAQGHSPRDPDPFASTTAGVFWVNHTWGADALLYALYQLGDGRALLLAKCVLVTALAGLFFCFRRRGTRLGIVALAAALAVVALGPWLPLQPALLSLLGVGLTLYLLERPALVEEARAGRARTLRWLLVPLFALWANLDAWFVLGPALVGLYALGEVPRALLGGARSARANDLPALALLTLAGLAACLLTPYHYHTFAWPTPLGLSHTEQVLMHDPLGQGLVVSPFATGFPTAPAFASPGGWAYCLLLAAGAASFVLAGRNVHPGRLLAWLGLAALSLYQARAIPFFAVAAGPVLALNLVATGGPPVAESRQAGRPLLRLLGVPAGLALLVLAWPGWLQPRPYHPRGWTVEPDDSLVRLARDLATWHADPKSQSARFALTFSPEAAHYLAWFCPAEKGFLDSRWPLFDRVADDFVRLRNGVLRSEGPDPDAELGPLLDAHRIDRILLYDPDGGRTTQAYRCLLQGGADWELLSLEGTAALFGRRAGAASPSPWQAFDWPRAAYHPDDDHRAPRTAPRTPRQPGPFDPFYRARDDRSPDRGEAALQLLTFDLMAERLRTQWLTAQATGLAGSGTGSDAAGTAGALAVRLYLTPLLSPSPGSGGDGRLAADRFAAGFLATHDRAPLAALLLAVRAGQRAVAANPEDARAFLMLGEAYLRLARQPREQAWRAALPEFATLRRAQTLTALEQAAALRPDLDEPHALLAPLYFEGGQLDRTLDHLRARLHIAEREAKQGGPDAASAAERRTALRADAEAVEAQVRRAWDIYTANAQGKTDPSTVVDRARLAQRHGLHRQALEQLLASNLPIFGKAGALMELDLMLGSGRAFDARDRMLPDLEAVIGFTPYHSLQACAAAACGDYAGADAELDRLGEPLRQLQVSPKELAPVRRAMALRVGGAVLARPLPGAGGAGLAATAFREFDEMGPLGVPAGFLRREADLRVLRGLLDLESGAVKDARDQFRAALDVWGDDRRAAEGAGLDFPSRPIARQMQRLLEDAGPLR
jgi:hypothetical protein